MGKIQVVDNKIVCDLLKTCIAVEGKSWMDEGKEESGSCGERKRGRKK